MIANSLTHISCLKTGDRFYIKSDPKKVVWELRYHSTTFHFGREIKKSKCRNDLSVIKDMNPNKVVVFLRSTAVIPKKRFYDFHYV